MIILLPIFAVLLGFSAPKTTTMIFLSEKSVTSYFGISLGVIADNDNCIDMGEGCFHPQFGFVSEGPKKEVKVEQVQVKTFNSNDTELVDCDKQGEYFDIFCGKESKVKGGVNKAEIWIDTSSSMRRVDFSKGDHCARRQFVDEIRKGCGEKFGVYTFDTSKKALGESSNLCLNYGLNNEERLITWIKDSQLEELIIVTDVNEMSPNLRAALDEVGAKLLGADFGEVNSASLSSKARSFVEKCSKK